MMAIGSIATVACTICICVFGWDFKKYGTYQK